MTNNTDIARVVDRFMRRMNAGVHEKAERVDTQKVGPIGGMLLLAIFDAGSMSMNEVVLAMGRDKSQITRLVQRLEGKNLLSRTASELDGRVSYLALTEKGELVVSEFTQIIATVLDDLLGPLDRGQKDQLLNLLRSL